MFLVTEIRIDPAVTTTSEALLGVALDAVGHHEPYRTRSIDDDEIVLHVIDGGEIIHSEDIRPANSEDTSLVSPGDLTGEIGQISGVILDVRHTPGSSPVRRDEDDLPLLTGRKVCLSTSFSDDLPLHAEVIRALEAHSARFGAHVLWLDEDTWEVHIGDEGVEVFTVDRSADDEDDLDDLDVGATATRSATADDEDMSDLDDLDSL